MNTIFAIIKNSTNKTQMLVRLLFFFLFLVSNMSNNVFAESIKTNIEELQKTYNQQLTKYNQSQNELERIYTEIAASENKLQSYEAEKNTAASALEEIQRIDRANPSWNLSENVDETYKQNRLAYQNYKKEDEQIKQLRTRSITLDREVKNEIIQLNNIVRNIRHAHDIIVAEEVEKRIAAFKKTTLVEGYAVVGCSEDTPRKCQKRAKQAARRDAAEKGSIVVVNAATRIENFQLTLDQVKTEVQAHLSHVEVLEKGWQGDTTYKYRIRAEVTPVISNLLHQQIEESIVHELGIVVPEEVGLNFRKASNRKSKKSLPPPEIKILTDAEKSFKEIDRKTGQAQTQTPRIHVEKKPEPTASNVVLTDSKDGIENWYTFWSMGFVSNSYPKDDQNFIDAIADAGGDRTSVGLDVLGFYWPANKSALYGVVISTAFDFLTLPNNSMLNGTVVDDFKADFTQFLLSISTLNFLGNKIGKGFFLRADAGYARAIAKTEFNSLGQKSSNEVTANGYGLLIGGGYSIPVSNKSRVLLGINYSVKAIEGDEYDTLAINVSGLW